MDRPIFEVGCAKSGTTFLGILLSMHPDVGPAAPDADGKGPQGYLNAMLVEQQFEPVAHRIERKEVWDRYLPVAVPLRIGAELTLLSNPLDDSRSRQLKEDLIEGFVQQRFLGKQPFNTFRVHVLRELFPDCKLVAIHRDGRDVIAAWGRKADRWHRFGGYRSAIEVFARKWNEAVDHIEAYKNELDILTLRYEDLATDLQGQLRRVLEHCELEYIPSIYDVLVARPQIGKWVDIIPAQFHRPCNDLTARNRRHLGYTTDEFEQRDADRTMPDTATGATFAAHYADIPKAMVPCPLCCGREFETIAKVDRHGIGLSTAMCQCCGLIMVNPRPPAAWYEDFYTKWFWSLYVGQPGQSLDECYVTDLCERKGELIGRQLLAERDQPALDFLDVGCGLGGLIEFFRRNRPGWNITGFDPSAEAVDFVRARTGAKVRQVSLEELEGHSSRYDMIAMIHVLEHTQDPVAVLRRVGELLAPDGIVYIEVPDYLSPHWHGRDFLHIAHNYVFDRHTLGPLLERAGLSAVRFMPSPVREHWSWAIGLFATVRPEGSRAPGDVARLSPQALQFRRRWMETKLAVQGSDGLWATLRSRVTRRLPVIRRLVRAYRAARKEFKNA